MWAPSCSPAALVFSRAACLWCHGLPQGTWEDGTGALALRGRAQPAPGQTWQQDTCGLKHSCPLAQGSRPGPDSPIALATQRGQSAVLRGHRGSRSLQRPPAASQSEDRDFNFRNAVLPTFAAPFCACLPAWAQASGQTRAGLCLLCVLSGVGERTRKPGLARAQGQGRTREEGHFLHHSESSPVRPQTGGGETRPGAGGGSIPPGGPQEVLCVSRVNKGLLPLGPCAFFHPHPRNSGQTFGSLHTPGGAHRCPDLPSALSLLPPWPAG